MELVIEANPDTDPVRRPWSWRWPGFVAVVGRELHVAARSKGTYWFRFLFVLATAGPSLAGIFYLEGKLPDSQMGIYMFRLLTASAATYCLVAGVETADCISRERREGTLGLLFLTDLKALDVVIGKIAATSLVTCYAILAALPVLGISIFLGGVTPVELVYIGLLLLNLMFFSLAAGAAVSSVSLVNRKAIGGTGLVIALFSALPFIPDMLNAPRSWAIMVEWASPITAIKYSFGVSPGLNFWMSMAWTFIFTLVLLRFAAHRSMRAWRDREPGRMERWWQEFVTPAAKASRRQQGLKISPSFWLWERQRQRGAHPAVILCALVAGLAFIVMLLGVSVLEGELVLAWGLMLNGIFKLWIIGSVAGLYNQQRRSGALELVLSTPITVEQLLGGTTRWLKQQFAWVLGCAVLIELIVVGVAATNLFEHTERVWQMSLTWLVGQAVVLLPDCWALVWVGMWLSLAKRNAAQAFVATMLRLVVLPWSFAWVGTVSNSQELTMANAFSSWFVISLVADLCFGLHAQSKLRAHFRTYAADPPWMRRVTR